MAPVAVMTNNYEHQEKASARDRGREGKSTRAREREMESEREREREREEMTNLPKQKNKQTICESDNGQGMHGRLHLIAMTTNETSQMRGSRNGSGLVLNEDPHEPLLISKPQALKPKP